MVWQKRTIEETLLSTWLGYYNNAVLNTHRAELLGRICMWHSISEEFFDLLIAVLTDMMMYIRLGFPLQFIRKLWQSIQKSNLVDEISVISYKVIVKFGPSPVDCRILQFAQLAHSHLQAQAVKEVGNSAGLERLGLDTEQFMS